MTVDLQLSAIIGISKSIADRGRTGSAIERYDVSRLWDLGDLLLQRGGEAIAGVPDGEVVRSVLDRSGLKVPFTFLRNSVRCRQYWPVREEFEKVAQEFGSYGKLKESIRLFDPALGVDPKELAGFRQYVRTATYAEVQRRATRLIARYRSGREDPVDIDTLLDDLDGAQGEMNSLLGSGNAPGVAALRGVIGGGRDRDLRLLLSALQSEQVWSKYERELSTLRLPDESSLRSVGCLHLGLAVSALDRLRKAGRRDVRRVLEGFPKSFFGDLATLVKAAASPEEEARYRKNQEVLAKFRSGATGSSS